jgi:hypothetical protein
MEWLRLELSILGSNDKENEEFNGLSLGLDVTAEKMHDVFLKNTPHFDGVKVAHNEMISAASRTIEIEKESSREMRNLSIFTNNLNVNNPNYLIPLETMNPENIIVEINQEKDMLRIIMNDLFGGNIETFLLDKDKKIKNGKWTNGFLELFY